jgi:hypothetical protein
MYNVRSGASPVDITRHLMNVTVRCKEAPILLVGTHADMVGGSSGLQLEALRARFPQVWWVSSFLGGEPCNRPHRPL